MKEIPTIRIDMDKKCSNCGAKGACQNGFCLECIAERIFGMDFISIGPAVAAKVTNQVQTLLTQHLQKIDEAYTKADNSLTVAFAVKLSLPALQRGILVETQISFIESKIKDVMGTIIDEKQMKLFEGKAA